MEQFKLYLILALLYFSTLVLSIIVFMMIQHKPELASLFLIQCIYTLGSYFLLGVGIAIPITILAGILGWGQMLLLVSGNIDPHLAKEGFFKVLDTLFSKI